MQEKVKSREWEEGIERQQIKIKRDKKTSKKGNDRCCNDSETIQAEDKKAFY